MSQNHDLETAFRTLVKESRHRLGKPPPLGMLLAYQRGDLSPGECQQVRQHLALTPATLDRFLDLIAYAPARENPHYLSDETLTHDWEAVRRRLRLDRVTPPKGRVGRRSDGQARSRTAPRFDPQKRGTL